MEKIHRDHAIRLGNDFRFQCSGPLIPEGTYNRFDSLKEAVTYIDRIVTSSAQQKRTKLKLDVLDDNGKPCVITGIHAGTANVLGSAADSGEVFPDVPWIKGLLTEKAAAQKRISEIAKALQNFGTSTRRGYGRIDPADYEARIKTMVDHIESAKKNALADERAKSAK
jgi:hypothetical protein